MNAIDYIKKCKEICASFETTRCRRGDCPLHEYGCGMPFGGVDIEAAVKLVEAWVAPEPAGETCPRCGGMLIGGVGE